MTALFEYSGSLACYCEVVKRVLNLRTFTGFKKRFKRGTYICARAWIFFKLCIVITHYIQTMKMYL